MALSLKKIDELVAALIGNAEELISEAKTLFGAKAYARAHALAHFSREEISKCVILHAAGARMLAGVEVDWKKTMSRLRSHKAKLRMETIQNAVFAASMGKSDMSDQMIQHADRHSEYRDDRKNASLYVGIDEGSISRPSEAFTEAQANRTISLAESALTVEKRYWKKIGPMAERKPGSLAYLKDSIQSDAKDLPERLKILATRYKDLLEKLHEEKE